MRKQRKSHTFLCQAICMNEKQPVVQNLSLSFPFTYFSRRCVFPKIQLKGFYNSFKFTIEHLITKCGYINHTTLVK